MGRLQSITWNRSSKVTYVDPTIPLLTKTLVRAKGCGPEEKDILYVNSLFNSRFSLLPILLWKLHAVKARKILIAPRGELGKAALGTRSWKKRPVVLLLRILLSSGNVHWHATGEPEQSSIKDTFSPRDANIHLHTNSLPPAEHFTPRESNILRVAFAARIVPIKGLREAFESLSACRERIHFDVVGGEEDLEYAQSCHMVAESLPENITVTFHGHQSSAEVRGILRSSHALLLPTQGENFGHSIAEALASGCLALIPDTTPWTPLVEAGCGQLLSGIARRDAETIDSLAADLRLTEEREIHSLELYRDYCLTEQQRQGSLFRSVAGSD